MAQWFHTLNIKEEWHQAKNNEITVQQLSEIIVKKLKKIKIDSFEKDDLIMEFIEFSEDKSLDKDDFDDLWNEFYDWADSNRVWVKIL